MRLLIDGIRIKEAIEFAKPYQPDAFLAVGGGSVIDTAKLMNLYTCYPGQPISHYFPKISRTKS